MRVGRNDPCPCGSGKKYKACCQERDRARAAMASVVGEETLRAAEAEWNEIARGEPVWEADVADLPIGSGDGPDSAPALTMVVAGGFVVHGGVVPSRPVGAVGRARATAEAVAAAGRSVGVLPERVRVREAAVAEALEALLAPKGIAVEAGPTPGLDEALADSLGHLAGNAVMARLTMPASWAETEASAEALADFHRAAAEFYRAAPWDALGDEPLLLTFPDGSEWSGALMGGAGEAFGLVLYSDADDLLDLYDDELEPEAHLAAMRGCTLTADFDRRAELTKAMRREIDAARWPIAGPAAYPRLFGMKLPEWRITAEHVARMTLALRAVTIVSRDDDADPEPETGVRVGALDTGPDIIWPITLDAQPITAEGPGADPEAALRGWDAGEEVERAEEARLARMEEWLALSDDVAPESMGVDSANARIWTGFLCFHALPAGAVTEFDLRIFLYDYYSRKAEAPPEAAEALVRGMRLVFRFLEECEGIRYPFAERVLAELEELAAGAAAEGESMEELLHRAQFDVYGDLDAREMIHDHEIPATEEGWPTFMDINVATLEHELQRRWLLWYDEVVRGGTTDYQDIHEVLLARQRAWENTPHHAFDGRTPVDVVRANRSGDTGADEEDLDR